MDPADPPMAQTPKEVIWKRGKIRLYRYLKQTEEQPRGSPSSCRGLA